MRENQGLGGTFIGFAGLFLFRGEGHAHLLEEGATVLIVLGRGGELDLHSEDAAGFCRGDFWEDRVILETDGVITLAIKLRWESTEVTDTRKDVADEAIHKGFHALAAEGHDRSHYSSFASLEVGDSFSSLGEHRLLAGDACEDIDDVLVELFAIHLGLVDTHVQGHLFQAWESVDIVYLQLFFQSSSDIAAEPFMESDVCHGEE